MKKIFLLTAILFSITNVFSQLTVNTAFTPAQLVNTIVGPGVSVSNVTVNAAPASSRGKFTCGGGCNVGFASGIILTCGGATIAQPPNPSSGQGAAFPTSGITDPDLSALTPGLVHEDASVLEFDFSVASDSVAFRYIFASDEYSDYANTNCNDAFGFFLSGPGIAGTKNIAIIPGTIPPVPVAINNVNNGGPVGHGTAPSGPCMNCTYFRDNTAPVTYTTAYDGLTTILVAGSRVQPCVTYHIKLAIGDNCDQIYDSGVFLEANSFSSLGQVQIYANGVSQPNNATVYVCQGDSITLSVNPAPNYNWNSGYANTQSITVTQANLQPGGLYACTITNPVVSCFAYTTFIHVIFVPPTATITPLGPVNLCPGGNVTLQANAGSSYLWSTGATTQTINVSVAGTYTVTVSQMGSNCSATSTPVTVTIGNPTASISGLTTICTGGNTTLTANAGQSYLWSNGSTTQAITVTTANTYTVTVTQAGGCTATANVNVTVNPLPTPNITGNTSICSGTSTSFNAGVYSSYLWNTGATTQAITPGTSGTYTVTVTDANGCTGTDNINLVVNPLPTPSITGTLSFCQGANSTLNAGAGYTLYAWSTGASTQTINITTGGIYTITVTNGFSCTASTSVNITVNPLPSPVIAGTAAFCAGSNTTLNAGAGYSSYIWSNGAVTQSINVSTASTFTVTVSNAFGCTGTATKVTTVNPLPLPNITGNTSICAGTSTSFNAGSFSTYLWNTGATSQTITPGTAGIYTVTVTDVNGCTGTDNINLTVNPLPTPSITGTNSFCQGANSNLNAGGGYINYLWSTGATSQVINVTTGGNYSVVVTNGFNCTAGTSINVTVNPLPVPVITGNASFCAGTNTTLNAGNFSSFLWSTGATTQTINVATAGTFTVTVTNSFGCVGDTMRSTTINPLPVPSITGTTTICAGANTAFNAGVYSSYIWNTGATSQTINTGTAGTYTVTVTDANGCTGTDNISLIVNPVPAPSISGNLVFCQGDNSTLNAGGGYTNYLWSNSATSQTINVTAGGNYSVIVTNGFNCTASTNVNVVVNPLPVPVISGGTGICFGSSTILNAGNGYANYAWSTGASTQTITVNTAGNYTVTVTNNNGCVSSTQTTMVINALPTPAITGNSVVCQGVNTTFNAGAGYSSYIWSTGSTLQNLVTGTAGIYTVTVTDVNGCTGSDNISLTVNPLPTPSIAGTTSFCSGSNSTLNAGGGYAGYLWSNGQTGQTINVTTAGNYSVIVTDVNTCTASASVTITVHSLPTPVISGIAGICQGTTTTLNTGNYTAYQWSTGATTQSIITGLASGYTVTVTDINGCVGTSPQYTVVVYSIPSAVISQNPTICIGASTSFNVSFTGVPPFKYTYSNGTSNFGPFNSPSNSATVNVAPANSTTYTLVSISDQHCNGTFGGSAVVTVNPLPHPVISGVDEICDGTTTVYNAGSGYTNYLWSNAATSQTITVGSTGNYIVTVTDLNGCVNSASKTLTVNQTPVVSFTNDTSLTCEDPIIHFTETSSYPAGSSFNWIFGDGAVSSEQNPVHQFHDPGLYPVSLTVTSLKGCTDNLIQPTEIKFYPLPVAKFVTDPAEATTIFNSRVDFIDQSEHAVSWKWDFGDENFDTRQNTQHYFDSEGKFRISLTVTNIAGCESTVEHEIFISPFWLPNAFTPNADGRNDVFFNSGYIMDVASLDMMIFNRWGQKIYESNNLNKPWNGVDVTGKDAPQGTYVYSVKVRTNSGKDYSYNGTVTLVR